MTTPNSGSPHSANARQLLQDLQDKFPVMRDCRPLAIGIDKQLLARLPDVDRKHLRIALGIHTHSLRYLKALEKAQVRLDLEGNPAGEVTPEQRVYAGGLVKERLERQAAQRRAQREADALARQHAEKLGRLVEKFGRLK
ncbi:MAG: ProQ/FinO family protein [Candidatus Accumulibacter sp.]|uniref:ProQ/FinO family protein n=1 Tax=Accumulibacter sp. TaxID=2053492 RepID=UPI00287AF52C|nr:ProQ/FinO family protein [Accumulibacter sp.]MDS4016477.1 ProQ/FinO family protein [Accumulibacter sp.]